MRGGAPEPDKTLMLHAARVLMAAITGLGLTEDETVDLLAGFLKGCWQDGWCTHRDIQQRAPKEWTEPPSSPVETRLTRPPRQP